MTDNVLTVDCSGLSCPEPALAAKKALTSTKSGIVEVLVDSTTSRDNVLRAGKRACWAGEALERDEGGFRVVFRK
ncbi:MAG: SirA family protein [Actinobacteria bacterium]|nr:SirA family protein [Actinomycetota bacterium]